MEPQLPKPNQGNWDQTHVAGGLSGREWAAIFSILLVGLTVAVMLTVGVPYWLVNREDYPCTTAEPSASCMGPAGADGIDDQALDAARSSARAPFGVLAGALLAGAAAAIGVIVSSHNARLTRDTINEVRRANKITEDRDRDIADRERARTDDERFTTAIEQLGHVSASVRLGGLYSLQRLAQRDVERLPTIVDVFCAYLRQPFHHPAHDWKPAAEQDDVLAEPPARAWWPANQRERDDRDAEGEVRRTAALLLTALLPAATSSTPPSLRIDLSGAMLDDLDFSGRRVASLELSNSYIDVDLGLEQGAHIDGDLLLRYGARINNIMSLDQSAYIGGDLVLGSGGSINVELLLGQDTYVGGHVILGSDAHIGNLILGQDAHIGRDLTLGEGAHIGGHLQLGRGAHIDGHLQLGRGAHIDGNLTLKQGAHISRDLQLEQDAHIDGNLTLADGARLKRALIHPEVGMSVEWFTSAGVPVKWMPTEQQSDHVTTASTDGSVSKESPGDIGLAEDQHGDMPLS
ncbi:hypothetical protein [Kineococcus sp. SYSU DK006]|uniref:hypothetical protein n=1 Tax=Kineococcus sp. SYSU DK006 TaxID=3383127 RepID=UPI003D7CAE47